MRVLHFLPVYVPAWHFGGPILSVSRLCEGLVKHGVEVRVITTNAGLPNLPAHQLGVLQDINGVQVIYYPVDHLNGVIKSRALINELPSNMIWADVVHLSSIWQPLGVPVQKAAHAFKVPVVQTLRGALGPYSWKRGWWKKIPYYLFIERPLLQRVAAIHYTTMQEYSETTWLKLRPAQYIVENPLDLDDCMFSDAKRIAWRSRLRIPHDHTVFLVAGRMHHKKGLDLLPSVLQGISRQQWSMIFVGKDDDGSMRSLRSNMSELGLADRCFWFETLPANQLVEVYSAADCLLLPSRHENFGNVVVEALACGCRVVASDRVGVTELLSDCPALNVVPRNKTDWTKALQMELSLCHQRCNSASIVRDRFSTLLISAKALSMYCDIIND